MNILIIAPHRDDEIIGVGGTLLKRKAAGDRIAVCIVTAAEGSEYSPFVKTVHSEMKAAHEFCGVDQYYGLTFRPNVLENYPRKDMNRELQDVIQKEKPDEVYIPFWGDMQKDHRVVADSAMVVMRAKYAHRPQRIYAYETLSETGINIPTEATTFIPNVFEDITDYLEAKKKAIGYFKSQIGDFPDLRSIESVEVLAKYRGSTVNTMAAEAFMLVREIKK